MPVQFNKIILANAVIEVGYIGWEPNEAIRFHWPERFKKTKMPRKKKAHGPVRELVCWICDQLNNLGIEVTPFAFFEFCLHKQKRHLQAVVSLEVFSRQLGVTIRVHQFEEKINLKISRGKNRFEERTWDSSKISRMISDWRYPSNKRKDKKVTAAPDQPHPRLAHRGLDAPSAC